VLLRVTSLSFEDNLQLSPSANREGTELGTELLLLAVFPFPRPSLFWVGSPQVEE